VFGANGSRTGFGGGLQVKRFVLEHEGALLPLRDESSERAVYLDQRMPESR
jgi:hypothetical protein